MRDVNAVFSGDDEGAARPAPKPWLVEGDHDAPFEEDVLNRIDTERGHVVAVARSKMMPKQRKWSLGQDYFIVPSPALEKELAFFLDALSEKMIREYEPAAATRSYAVLRPLLARMHTYHRLNGRGALRWSVTHEGAHAVLVELREYVGTDTTHPLRRLLKALREGKKLAKGGK